MTEYAYKLLLPDWALSLTTKLRQVRDAFNEIQVCVYFSAVSNLLMIYFSALHT